MSGPPEHGQEQGLVDKIDCRMMRQGRPLIGLDGCELNLAMVGRRVNRSRDGGTAPAMMSGTWRLPHTAQAIQTTPILYAALMDPIDPSDIRRQYQISVEAMRYSWMVHYRPVVQSACSIASRSASGTRRRTLAVRRTAGRVRWSHKSPELVPAIMMCRVSDRLTAASSTIGHSVSIRR